MRSRFSVPLRLLAPVLAAAAPQARAANAEDVVRAFENQPGYVRPLATLYGSLTNSGWNQSAALPRGFSFYLGIPLNFTQIADADRSYRGSLIDTGCILYHRDQPDGTDACPEQTGFTGPTIFGRKAGPTVNTHNWDPIDDKFNAETAHPQNDGNPEMSAFNWFPFGEPQLGLSYFHTEAKFRFIALPLDIFSFSLPGFGLQHDFAWAMPDSPVHVSVEANWSWLSATWTPGGDIDGSLNVDGTSAAYQILAGWTWKRWLEVFAETGWETSTLKTGGHLVIHSSGEPDEDVRPGLTLEGRNGFRIALNVAVHLGYDAVLGQNFGAEFGNQAGLLAYRFKRNE